jgi:hypothetical protein
MSDDFCLIHGYDHMKSQMGNPIPFCQACEEPMGITFGDQRIDAGDFDPPDDHPSEEPRPYGEVLDEMGHEAKYQPLLNEFSTQRALLLEALAELNHARVFISSREKMHPVGIGLYDDLIERIDRTVNQQSGKIHEQNS